MPRDCDHCGPSTRARYLFGGPLDLALCSHCEAVHGEAMREYLERWLAERTASTDIEYAMATAHPAMFVRHAEVHEYQHRIAGRGERKTLA